MKAATHPNLLIAPLALSLLGPVLTSAADSTPHQQLGREIFRELIETDTTHSTGDTTRAAEALARRFRAAGFPESDVSVVGPKATNRNRVVRQLGIPTYGVGGGTWDVDDLRAHGKDERVGVDDFYKGLEFEYELVKTAGSATILYK